MSEEKRKKGRPLQIRRTATDGVVIDYVTREGRKTSCSIDGVIWAFLVAKVGSPAIAYEHISSIKNRSHTCREIKIECLKLIAPRLASTAIPLIFQQRIKL